MPNIPNNWGADLYKFVGKSFDINSAKFRAKRALFDIIGEVTTNSAYYDIAASGDFPELPKYDGSQMNKINPARGFRKIVAPEERMGSYDIHYKQWLNDMSGEAAKAGKQLSDSAQTTVYLDICRLFQRAYDSNYAGADGKAWAATDHPVASKGTKDGSREYEADTSMGTFSNKITDALSVAAIDKARTMASRFVTPSGNPYLGEYDLLLVSPELEATAAKLLGMDAKLKPMKDPSLNTAADHAENAASSIYDLRYMVVGGGNVGFTAKQWAICDSSKLKEIAQIVYNTKPETKQAINTNPYIKTFVAYADYDIGFADARPIIFSDPA